MKKANVLLSLFIGTSLLAQDVSDSLRRVDVTLPTLPAIPKVTLPTLPTLPSTPKVTLPTLPALPTITEGTPKCPVPEVTPKPPVPGTQDTPKIDVQIVVPPTTGPTLPPRPPVTAAEPIPVVTSYIKKLYKRPTDKTYTKIELTVTGVVPTAGWTKTKLVLARKNSSEVTYYLASSRPIGVVAQVESNVAAVPLTIDVTNLKQVVVLSKGKPLVVWKAESSKNAGLSSK